MALLSILSNLLPQADKIIDEVITSKEEALKLRNELRQIISDEEAIIEQEVTKRWQADMTSDSWLSKNVRPLVLIWLVVSTTLLIFIDAGAINFIVDDKWVDLLQIVLITCIGAYFGSRGLEKIKNNQI